MLFMPFTASCSQPLTGSVCVETNGLNNVETRSKFYIVLLGTVSGMCELYHGPPCYESDRHESFQ